MLYNNYAGFVAVVKSWRIMLYGVHSGFVDLKKLSNDSGLKHLALESERTSGVLNEIS